MALFVMNIYISIWEIYVINGFFSSCLYVGQRRCICLSRLPLGTIILVVLLFLVFFGLAHRLLDRMRLSDKGALIVIGALLVGSFLDIPLAKGNIQASLNIGGGLVPVGLAGYLLFQAGTTKEWVRAIVATVVTAGVIYVLGSVVMQGDPRDRMMLLDPLYVYPLVGGLTAYLLGRSRRAAFVAATLGVLSQDFIHLFWLRSTGTPGTVHIGGAGAFDSIVIAGLVAVLLAEILGETRERLQGGPATRGRDPELLRHLNSDLKIEGKAGEEEKKEGEGDEEEYF
jgi:uncharacterized membrane protein